MELQLGQIAAICTRLGKSLTDLFATSKYLFIPSLQTHLEETEYDIISKCAYKRGTRIENLTH